VAQLGLAAEILYFSAFLTVVASLTGWLFGEFDAKQLKGVRALSENTTKLEQGNSDLHTLNSAPAGFAGVGKQFKDMAEQLNATIVQLKESEERTRSIIQDLPLGILTCTSNAIVETANERALKMFGYSASTINGVSLATMLPESDSRPRSSPEPLETVTVKHDTEAVRAGGEKFPAKVWLRPILFADGDRMLVSVADLTKEHEIEKLKQEFIAMVSHDLRTPLTAVHATLTLFRTGNYGTVNEAGMRRIQMMEDLLHRLLNLVNQLLDFEKMGSGQFEIEISATNIQTIIDRSLTSVEAAAGLRNVRLDCAAQQLVVMADEERIVQVLVNLLGNAIKFSPADEVVSVGCSLDGDWIEVSVADKGRGIPEAFQQSIFEKFKQVDAKDSSKLRGSGLGLAICKAIIEQHGGQIGVNSQEGKGSRFWFRLPASAV